MNRHLSSGIIQIKDPRKEDNEKRQTMQADEIQDIRGKFEIKSLAAAAVTVTPAITIRFSFTLTPGRSI